jgi:hypothetical protein
MSIARGNHVDQAIVSRLCDGFGTAVKIDRDAPQLDMRRGASPMSGIASYGQVV